MLVLTLGLFLFFGVHSIQIFLPDIREHIITRGGSIGAWMWPYTVIAGIGLVLIIVGYGMAQHEAPILYYPPLELRKLALVVMLPVFPLLLATYIKGSIRRVLGHPMLIAIILWASAHLLANGSLADLFLFGSFLLWAVLDWRSLVRRQGASASGNNAIWGRNDVFAIVGGLALYFAFIGNLHSLLFGVPPV